MPTHAEKQAATPAQQITKEKLVKTCLTLLRDLRLQNGQMDIKHEGKTFGGSKVMDASKAARVAAGMELSYLADALNYLVKNVSSSKDMYFSCDDGNLTLRSATPNIDVLLAQFEQRIEERFGITADAVRGRA